MRPAGRALVKSALKTALIAAICIGPIFAVRAATVTGETQAVVVTPLSLVKFEDLRFGRIIAGATSGTVTISNTSGARTSTGPVTLVGGDFGPARFAGLGNNNFFVRLRRATSGAITLDRVGGGASMTLTNLTGVPDTRIFPTNGILLFAVGGRLNVGPGQMAGTYVGTIDLQLIYF